MNNCIPMDIDDRGIQVTEPSDDLLKFKRGEITKDEYLQARLTLAMAHVCGALTTDNFELIREVITEKLETDPALVAVTAQFLGA